MMQQSGLSKYALKKRLRPTRTETMAAEITWLQCMGAARQRGRAIQGKGEGMSGNVIELKFRSPHVGTDQVSFICCGTCRNKTFTLVEDRPKDFPLMRCSACGTAIGRMGWAHDDDPVLNGDQGA